MYPSTLFYYGLCLIQGACLFAAMAIPYALTGGFATLTPHQWGIFTSCFLGLWVLLCLGTGLILLRALKILSLSSPVSRRSRVAVVQKIRKPAPVSVKPLSLKLFDGGNSVPVEVSPPSAPQICQQKSWNQNLSLFATGSTGAVD